MGGNFKKMQFRNVPLFASSQTLKLECERRKINWSGPGGFTKTVNFILHLFQHLYFVTKYFVQAVVLKTQKRKLEMKH